MDRRASKGANRAVQSPAPYTTGCAALSGLGIATRTPDVPDVLIDKPTIVIAKPPRRIKRKRKPVALASIIVDKLKPDMTEEELRQRREAADRLW